MAQYDWRPMMARDIATVAQISDAVHGRYTERAEVYAERLSLYSAGCHVLAKDEEITGYLICHPWMRAAPPALDAMLSAIPPHADCLYVHDLALMPAARGTGAGKAATQQVLATARTAGLREIRLVAVNGAEGFWAGQGFVPVTVGDAGDSYGSDAVPMWQAIAD